MKYKVIFGDDIDSDLNNISDYIERITFSIDKSEQIVGEIISSIGVLAIFPYMYQKFYKNYHSINIKNHIVIYYINEEKKKLLFIGFYDKLKIMKIFCKNSKKLFLFFAKK